ncbi:hypothetical protein EB796_020340 [Bugula neritina]|uniref:Uncharacterized protein n=1 Tax=Bugula neritina TaxID=10212 RepID=A0A7J7J5C9_BUGNE|nr:hypothetical protein EB796_020340 [Bugula neritina]
MDRLSGRIVGSSSKSAYSPKKPDGKLVWEKLPRDVFAFRFTVLLCAGGMALLANTYYKMAYGIKPES